MVLFVFAARRGLHAFMRVGRAGPWIDRADHLVLLWQLALWGVTAVTFWTKHHLAQQAADGSDAIGGVA